MGNSRAHRSAELGQCVSFVIINYAIRTVETLVIQRFPEWRLSQRSTRGVGRNNLTSAPRTVASASVERRLIQIFQRRSEPGKTLTRDGFYCNALWAESFPFHSSIAAAERDPSLAPSFRGQSLFPRWTRVLCLTTNGPFLLGSLRSRAAGVRPRQSLESPLTSAAVPLLLSPPPSPFPLRSDVKVKLLEKLSQSSAREWARPSGLHAEGFRLEPDRTPTETRTAPSLTPTHIHTLLPTRVGDCARQTSKQLTTATNLFKLWYCTFFLSRFLWVSSREETRLMYWRRWLAGEHETFLESFLVLISYSGSLVVKTFFFFLGFLWERVRWVPKDT